MSFGTSLRRYYRGDELVAVRQQPAGQPASTPYCHFDHQGATQCLTDSTGAVTDRFAANAWGVEVKRTGSSINRHWYVGNAGYYRHVDRTLDYVRARYAQPGVARWVSRDPAALYEDPWYTYGDNNPDLMIDPLGLACLATNIVGSASASLCVATPRWILWCICRCKYDLQATWTLDWTVPLGGNVKDCWVEQYVDDGRRGNYKKDDKEGWPYPHTCTTTVRKKRPSKCSQYDTPGLHGDPYCFQGDRQHLSFLTCLCGKEGVIACFTWHVDFALGDCKVTQCASLFGGRSGVKGPVCQTPPPPGSRKR